MNKIKIGWSEVSLVPNGRKVNLAGQFYERITDEVETPITSTAMAIECGDDCAIFCSCDLVSTSHHLLESVRERLVNIDGFPVDKVMINSIHTHTAPDYGRRADTTTMSGSAIGVLQSIVPSLKYEKLVSYEGDDLLKDEEAHAFLADRIAEAAKQAWEHRKEGMYAQGFGRAAVGLCRRVCYTDGSAKMWGDTDTATFTELEAGNDSGIEMLFTFTADKKLTGVVANVACPAQVLEHRSFISSDYWGKVKAFLRKEYGEDIFVLGLCSAAGDQCPRDLVRWVEPETPINDPNIIRNNVVTRKADPSMFDVSGCTLIGRRIVNEIFYAFESLCDEDYITSAKFEHKRITIDMPLRRVTPAEKDAAISAIESFAEKVGDRTIDFKDSAKMHIHAGVVLRSQLQETVDVVPIEVHIIRLGDIVFATNPYELFLDFGNQIKARSKASQTFLVQLSCGNYGYLPTKKAEQGSHYSAYVSSGMAGHAAGDLLVRTTVQNINELMNK